jgi:hypothetical protein
MPGSRRVQTTTKFEMGGYALRMNELSGSATIRQGDVDVRVRCHLRISASTSENPGEWGGSFHCESTSGLRSQEATLIPLGDVDVSADVIIQRLGETGGRFVGIGAPPGWDRESLD